MISGRVVPLTLGSLSTVEGLKVPLKLTAEAETREDGGMIVRDLVRSSNAQTMYRRFLSTNKKKCLHNELAASVQMLKNFLRPYLESMSRP